MHGAHTESQATRLAPLAGSGDRVAAVTDAAAEAPPQPHTSSARRIRRAQRGRPGWTTLPRWTTLTTEELDGLPVGSRRTTTLVPGVFVTLVKRADGCGLLTRSRISSKALADLHSAPRVPVAAEAPR